MPVGGGGSEKVKQGFDLLIFFSPATRTVEALSARLKLRPEHVQRVLEDLRGIQLVENHGSAWRAVEKNIHIPKTSRFNGMNHNHWRQKAVQNAFLQTDDIHYTSVCTPSRADVLKMKQMMLEFIDKGREVIAPSAEEELYCLNCDWFRV